MTTKQRHQADHVVMRGDALVCDHCGAKYEIKMPCPMNLMLAASDAFVDDHRGCLPPAKPVCVFCRAEDHDDGGHVAVGRARGAVPGGAVDGQRTEALRGDAGGAGEEGVTVDPDHLQRTVDALATITTPVASEARLHELVAVALAAAGLAHEHEADLGDGGRIDFLTAGGVGIEVKIAGARNEILRQIHGYALADRVLALVLFTTRAAHAPATTTLNGKPIVVVRSRGWL